MSKAIALADLLSAYELSEDYVDATKDAAAELRRLDAENKALRDDAASLEADYTDQVLRAMAAEGECKTLRDALEDVATYPEHDTVDMQPYGWIGFQSGKFIKNVGQKTVQGTPLYLHPPTAPTQPDLSRLEPWVHGLGKAILRELQAAPAQQPLSNEQILHFVDIYVGGPTPSYPLGNSDWINFARAIEAAHGRADFQARKKMVGSTGRC